MSTLYYHNLQCIDCDKYYIHINKLKLHAIKYVKSNIKDLQL